MVLRLATNSLRSRSIRQIATNGETIRSIRSGNDPVGLWKRITNFLGQMFQGLLTFGGWLTNQLVSAVSFSFTGAWGLFTQSVSYIYNFNWQTTDASLNQRITALRTGLISRYGGALGNMVGWIACGIVPAAGVMTFNSLLGAYLLKEVGEEAIDEISNQLIGLIRASFSIYVQEVVINTFKNTRKAIKKWNEGLSRDTWEREALDYFFQGRSEELIDTWGDKDRKPWSFRIWIENEIESIPNQSIQNFVEEFYEELIDGCVEAGYVVAQGLDSWVLQQQMTADAVRGRDRVVEIVPDRDAEDNQSGETLTLAGGENEIRAQLPQTMANYQLVENRDIGQWVGETIRDSTRANPSELTVRLMLYSVKAPPYSKAEQRATITLHDFKRSKLDWHTIKRAIGGGTGYTYGRYRATGKLDSGRQLVVYASTEEEAESQIYALEKLIDPKIQVLNITEERKTGARANGKPLQKQPIKIYPAYLYIESKQRILNQGTNARGFQTLDGTYNTRRFTIELFPDEKPNDFERVVAQALATPGIS